MQKSLRNGCFDKMDKIKEDMIKAEERGEFKEWNLSDKILNDFDVDDYLTIEDVREFVKQLKARVNECVETGQFNEVYFEKLLMKLAGAKLCE